MNDAREHRHVLAARQSGAPPSTAAAAVRVLGIDDWPWRNPCLPASSTIGAPRLTSSMLKNASDMADGLWKMAKTCLFYPSALSHLPSGRPFSAACPSADGQRSLVNAYPSDSQSSLDLLINWPASLARQAVEFGDCGCQGNTRSISASSADNGTPATFSTALWNALIENLSPSFALTFSRSSTIFNWPIM